MISFRSWPESDGGYIRLVNGENMEHNFFKSSIFHFLEKQCSGSLFSLDVHWEIALRKVSAQQKKHWFSSVHFQRTVWPLRPGVYWLWSRKENFKKSTSKKNNEKIWILKSIYGKHSIYFLDILEKFKYSDRPFGKVWW